MSFATVQSWDETPASNTEIDGVNIDEGCNPSGINNAIRELMSQVAAWTGADTIASATTTDLSTVNGQYVEITGTTTITGLGTVKAGWVKFVKFAGALTLTHNGTSLILPGAANITTAAGDTFLFASEGSGNWRCLAYQRADGLVSFANGSAAAPSVSFASDPDSGMYRVGANQIGLATTGILRVTVDQNGVTTTVPMLPPGTGSAAAPDYSFSNDTDIGMYRSGANQLAWSTAGAVRATMDANAFAPVMPVRVPDGSAGAPALAFTSDTNTGFYSVSADTIGISSGGSVVGYYNSTGLTAATTTATATFGSVAAVKNLSSGQIDVTRDGGTAIRASRFTDDGIVISIHNDATLVGSISFSGSTTSFNTSSDERLKPAHTRVPLEQEIDIDAVWEALEVLAYNMIDGETLLPVDGRYYGMLAQKLYRIYPQAVTPGKGEPGQPGFEPWSVDYSKLVPLMIARQKQFERRTNERFAALGL